MPVETVNHAERVFAIAERRVKVRGAFAAFRFSHPMNEPFLHSKIPTMGKNIPKSKSKLPQRTCRHLPRLPMRQARSP